MLGRSGCKNRVLAVNLRKQRRYYTVMDALSVTRARCAPRAAAVLACGQAVTQNAREQQAGRISAWAPGEEEALGTDPTSARDDAECELLERVAAGEREALAELYHAYARRLFAFLGRLAPDAATAEELVQDTLLAVWRSAGTFQRRSTVRTWVYAVARRQAHNRLRRPALTLVTLDEAGPIPDDAATPEQHALRTAERDHLAGLLAQLSLVHREALALFFIAELSYAETAEVLDVPVGTVKSRLSNARRALARLAAAEGAPS